ncbi:MAG: ABC transporter substrate-binding protein [Candidatus Cohnella colombiensis]|uniref:ABC transporter substrate-binding protein n=1 Tax=Candidatus Cohnella colombiensis TaxID=3121368 RepID=A0AA95EWA2_9BACL|nr:MAG: ABC transporter substrate-binding protein [Cohnella sp.]
MMKKQTLLLLAVLLIVITGCTSNQSDSSANQNPNAAIVLIDSAGRTIKFNEVPQNIVALSNGEMDIIYALGGKLVGKPTSTESSPILTEAEGVEQIGSTHEVDLEKLMFVRPHVVLGTYPLNSKDIAPIESIGTKLVLTSANSIEDIKNQIRLFGQMLQKEHNASTIIQKIDDKLTELASQQPAEKVRVLMIYGAPGSNMAALPNSLSGNVLDLVGGVNIAASFESLQNFPQYATLNTERIIEANPQLIVIMAHGNPEVVRESFIKELQSNAAWSNLDAVKNNHVEILPSDLFGTNPGTRITESLDMLHNMIQTVGSTS